MLQAMVPFSKSELSYIANLDAAADITLLRTELPSLHEGCLRVLEVSTLVLQKYVHPGHGRYSYPGCRPSMMLTLVLAGLLCWGHMCRGIKSMGPAGS